MTDVCACMIRLQNASHLQPICFLKANQCRSWDDLVLEFEKQFEICGMLLCTAELVILRSVFPLFIFF
jgi:hypothetical protein